MTVEPLLRSFDTREAAASAIAEYLDGDVREFVLDERNWRDAREWLSGYFGHDLMSPYGCASTLLTDEAWFELVNKLPRDRRVSDLFPMSEDGFWRTTPREWLARGI